MPVFLMEARAVVQTHDETTLRWHQDSSPDRSPDCSEPVTILSLVEEQHRANFDLWHQEDRARDTSASPENIAIIKHAIDALNQRRNDLVEAIDQYLLAALPAQNAEAPLHSETPGLIVDRLSILALKIYHTHEEACRQSATETHRCRNENRLAVLVEQRSDLAHCLDILLADVSGGQRRFKLYRQMKMYNDPELNPVLYNREGC